MSSIRSLFRIIGNERFKLLASLFSKHINKPRRIIMYQERLGGKWQGAKPFLLLWSLPLWSQSTYENAESSKLAQTEKAKRSKLIKQADDLFNAYKFHEIILLLQDYKDSKDIEILWRLARAQYNLAQEKRTPEEDKKSLIFEAYSLILEALEIDDNHFAAHKWMAVLLDARSAYDGLKARITQLERVKSHMLRATELNPKDATTLHMIGSWCYQIADMPWIHRKIAATIFVAPPTSSYEEALTYFLKAEEVEPKFYSQNLLMLGKTYLKLKKEDQARFYLEQARTYPPSSEEDQTVRKEAHQLLSSLKPKQDSVDKPLHVPV